MSEIDEKGDKIQDIPVEDVRFKEDPESIYRIYSVISYVIVLVIIGIPVWWQTTKVYRAPLPLEDMFNIQIPSMMIRPDSIPLSLEYDILITIVNPEPEKLKVDINSNEIAANLQNFIHTLTPIANFTVKSQWLYLVDLGIVPVQGADHLMVYEHSLTHVITPLEKKTWAHMSPRPSLNLVIYFPHCKSPLYVYTDNKVRVPSNAFLNLRWGGMMINNADVESCKTGFYKPDLKPIVDTFLTQLQKLMYLKSLQQEDVRELEMLRAWEMVTSTRRTLKSLAQLLIEINSIVISDEVAEKIQIALKMADEAVEFLNAGDVASGLKSAKIAYANSEAAFSDPSLLALLYFPDDQKYAVYIPLFLPIMIPVFMSLVTIQKWLKSKMTTKVKTN